MFVVSRKNNEGFTLIELLVVIAIIGVLASIVLASLNGSREKAKIAATQAQLKSIETAVQLLYADTGYYPSAQNLIKDICFFPGNPNEIAMSDPNAGLVANGRGWTGWNGPYIRTAIDPWGTPYFFDSDYECRPDVPGCRGYDDAGVLRSSVVMSCGPNGDEFTDSTGCIYDNDNIVWRFCSNQL